MSVNLVMTNSLRNMVRLTPTHRKKPTSASSSSSSSSHTYIHANPIPPPPLRPTPLSAFLFHSLARLLYFHNCVRGSNFKISPRSAMYISPALNRFRNSSTVRTLVMPVSRLDKEEGNASHLRHESSVAKQNCINNRWIAKARMFMSGWHQLYTAIR